MTATYSHVFNTPSYKGTTTINTGIFINGRFVDKDDKIDVFNPVTGKVITSVSAASKEDVDMAVDAATTAYKTSWGLKVSGAERGKLLNKLADLVELHADELAALETLNVGKSYGHAKVVDLAHSIICLRYYAGWADKIYGKSVESESFLRYTRREPIGVVGQITPWNFPLLMVASKIAPALATGNTVVLKPSEVTPLTALRFAALINEAGFPAGVVNILPGYGNTAGQAISEHPRIMKVAFTGSTLTGRKIMEAAAKSNLKPVTLELGGKSPNIIFDDAELGQAIKWAAHGIFFNVGQTCIAGSRIFVQEGIYDRFIEGFTAVAKALNIGDPFQPTVFHGPQVSQAQFNRVMGFIESGKRDGARLHLGGTRHGQEGYYIEPTIFTDVTPTMQIVREEIFGPVAVVIKFKDEADAIEQANDTTYGLGAAVFTQNIARAIRVSNAMEAGTVWVNCILPTDISMPFGGYKQSGIGREMGEYALDTYTAIKAVHINAGMAL